MAAFAIIASLPARGADQKKPSEPATIVPLAAAAVQPLPPAEVPGENVAPGQPAGVIPTSGDVFTIDLEAAWRLAGVQNPTINIARMAILEAEAVQRKAKLIWLPNLNAGTAYHNHVGSLLASSGQIRQLDESSLYVGGGSRVLAAESLGVPMVQFIAPLADAIYEPLALRQEVMTRRFDLRATDNDILLETTLAYFDLLSAQATFEAMRRSRLDVQQIIDTTVSYAKTGQGRQGDANRALADGYLVLRELQQAEEELAIASAALARLLQLDPSTQLRTPDVMLETINVVDLSQPLVVLTEVALRQRPEMGATASEISASRIRVRQERMRPILPLLQAGYSAGAFGGTGNFLPGIPPFTALYNRTDLDVMAVWTLQNAGFGNIGKANMRRAQLSQAVFDRVRTAAQVRAEVTGYYGAARARRQNVQIAMRRLGDAEYAFQEDYNRLRGGEALPIEVLNSVRLLVDARLALINAYISDNEAQFELFVAMGQPPFRAAAEIRGQMEQVPPPQR